MPEQVMVYQTFSGRPTKMWNIDATEACEMGYYRYEPVDPGEVEIAEPVAPESVCDAP